MAASSGVLLGWSRPMVGREAEARELFQWSMGYYARLQSEGKIDSFEPALIEPHGGDFNGFVLLRGEQSKLDAVRSSEEFLEFVSKANYCVEGVGVMRVHLGEGVQKQMVRFYKNVK
jgi:hypothetical protein